jgi:hypothetical protein
LVFTRWLMPCVTVCPFADIGVLRGLKNAMEDSRASFFKSLGSPPEDHPLKEMLPRFTKVCPPPPPPPAFSVVVEGLLSLYDLA